MAGLGMPWGRRRSGFRRPRGGGEHEAAPAFTDVPTLDGAGRPVRVTVLSRRDCHLCEQAVAVVRRVCEGEGVGWAERDLDAVPQLLERYAELVPVVFVDGRQLAHWRLPEAVLRRALHTGGGWRNFVHRFTRA